MSPWATGKISRIQGNDYSPEFPLALALKDVHLALEEADPERFAVLAGLLESGSNSSIRDSATRT
jgi:3-hydroxyisobutyrate dehydrogenase